jgi:hypothetical protein
VQKKGVQKEGVQKEGVQKEGVFTCFTKLQDIFVEVHKVLM